MQTWQHTVANTAKTISKVVDILPQPACDGLAGSFEAVALHEETCAVRDLADTTVEKDYLEEQLGEPLQEQELTYLLAPARDSAGRTGRTTLLATEVLLPSALPVMSDLLLRGTAFS